MCCVLCVRLGVFQPGTKQKSIALHCFVSKWLLANIPLSRVSFEWKETLNQSVKCFLKAETTLEYHLAEPISLSKHISQLIFLAKFWLHFYLSYFNESNNQICMIKKNKYKGKHIFSSYFSRISSRTPLLSRGAIMGGYIWISGYIYG